MNQYKYRVAYFSMEVGIHPDVQTYAGGLGVLAGDTVRSAADLHVPMVAVTLLHRNGYFFQRIDRDGWQTEEPAHWAVEEYLQPVEAFAEIEIEGRTVRVRSWRYDVTGDDGFVVPVFFLDTDLPENGAWDRKLTSDLYGGDRHYRLCQEAVLGIGGVRMLRALGYDDLQRFHMNEGHAALLSIELLRELSGPMGQPPVNEHFETIRRECVFTTHTPVPAGHDKFDLDMVNRVLGERLMCGISGDVFHEGRLNMTYLALSISHYINGVAKRHRDVTRHMFAEYEIESITNGVHAATWVAEPFAALFDVYIPGWRKDNFSLRYALAIPDDEVWNAHRGTKQRLVEFVNRSTGSRMEADVLTVGFARRATAYKRPDLVFDDLDRLQRIARDAGRLQLVFAGKAHPQDEEGKRLIQHIVRQGRAIDSDMEVVYLPNYDMNLARLLTSGVDAWLNTPEPPLEASGTSGMKCALNGVPSLSILDGWWIEGCIEGVTGWAIGSDGLGASGGGNRVADSAALYEKLEQVVVPKFYTDRAGWIEMMRHAIALNGSFFNTQRMMQQYVLNAYYK